MHRLWERGAYFIVYTQRCDQIFAKLMACKYAEYELCDGCFSMNFLQIFRTAFSKIAADRTFFLKLWFTPCKAEQPLRGMELQEKDTQKDYNI